MCHTVTYVTIMWHCLSCIIFIMHWWGVGPNIMHYEIADCMYFWHRKQILKFLNGAHTSGQVCCTQITADALHINWWHTTHKCVIYLPNVLLTHPMCHCPNLGRVRGLYPPPHNPCGLHWTPLDSSQARLRPDWLVQCPVQSTGLPVDCKPLFRVQSQSSGLRVQ